MATKKVSITSSGYSPSSTSVKVGDTVSFKNDDNKVHGVEFDPNPVPAPAGNANISPGAVFDVVFPTAGTFNYKCCVNPVMTGSVTVTA